MPARLDYCRLIATDMVLRPGDGDSPRFFHRPPWAVFFWADQATPALEVTVTLLLSEVQINCEQLGRSHGAQ